MNKRKSNIQYCTIKPIVGIANTNGKLMEKCHAILDSFGIGHHFSAEYRIPGNNPNHKGQKAIQIIGFKRVRKFIEIFGSSVEKQQQIEIIKEFISYRLAHSISDLYGAVEEGLYNSLRISNQRGILNDYTPNTLINNKAKI